MMIVDRKERPESEKGSSHSESMHSVRQTIAMGRIVNPEDENCVCHFARGRQAMNDYVL